MLDEINEYDLSYHKDHSAESCAFKRILLIKEFVKMTDKERQVYLQGLTDAFIVLVGPQLYGDTLALDAPMVYQDSGLSLDDNTLFDEALLNELHARLINKTSFATIPVGNPLLN